MQTYHIDKLKTMTEEELRAVATELHVKDLSKEKDSLIYSILEAQAFPEANLTTPPKARERKSSTTATKATKEKVEAKAKTSKTADADKPKRAKSRKEESEKRALEAVAKAAEAHLQSEQQNNLPAAEAVVATEVPVAQPPKKIVFTSKKAKTTPIISNIFEGDEEINKEADTPKKTIFKHKESKSILEEGQVLDTTSTEHIEKSVASPEDKVEVSKASTKATQTNKQAPNRSMNPAELFPEGILKAQGILEVMTEGYGFLRSGDYNYLPSPDDVYLSPQQIKQNALRSGDLVEAFIRPPKENEKYFPLTRVVSVNGRTIEEMRDRIPFDHLIPIFPDEKFRLESREANINDKIALRVVDLFSPIGKGQRGLIVAQPKTGKTMLLKDIANAIANNHPEVYMIILLIDERPEEVTDMATSVNAEVVASTFDEPAERHVRIAEIVLNKAKRMVESGQDVVILLDSITRLARAYNTVQPASGKVLSGGVDANALQKPKRFFGAARNIKGGGSLTIIATALQDTGSKMDDVIFEEFKGTGNMELQLDRRLANKRVFPAVDLVASSTRRDDLLQSTSVVSKMWGIRKILSEMNPIESMEMVKRYMDQSPNNEAFLTLVNS